MPNPQIPLDSGKFYHIYNRGINSCNLFREPANYEHFLELYDKYISPVAETYAWVLMPNHFHLLVRVKEDVVYKYSYADRSIDAVRFEEQKWQTILLSDLSDLSACEAPDSVKIPKPHLHFSHLFNAYCKYFNTRTGRHGALFERSFKRKEISNKYYFRKMVLYIHNNPVHHQFTEHAMDYPWSSYLTCVSVKPTKLQRDAVIGWFDNEANFKYLHDQSPEIEEPEDLFE
jgi:REP element-mobilizing transposase RayT